MARASAVWSVVVFLVACSVTAQQPTFDVASVRRNVSGLESSSYVVRPNGAVAVNYQLQDLIAKAYGIRLSVLRQRIVGGDEKLMLMRFDIGECWARSQSGKCRADDAGSAVGAVRDAVAHRDASGASL